MKHTIHCVKYNTRFHYAVTMTASIAFSMALLAYRVHFSDTITYVFLSWNLFLAIIPFAISSFILLYEQKISKLLLLPLVFSWLVFFPNAPYIITDLFHLDQRQNVPLWYDLMLILSFCFNGLILTFLSLADIHRVLNKRFDKLIGWLFVLASIFLTGFGVYVGRYLRWNSWDVLANPISLFNDLLVRFVNPFSHPKTWGFTLLFSMFLLISYVMVRQLMRVKRE